MPGVAGLPRPVAITRRGFRDDQPARCRALPIIFRVQRPWRETRLLRPHPRQGRHYKAMIQMVRTDLQR